MQMSPSRVFRHQKSAVFRPNSRRRKSTGGTKDLNDGSVPIKCPCNDGADSHTVDRVQPLLMLLITPVFDRSHRQL